MTQPPQDPEEPLGGSLTPQPADEPESGEGETPAEASAPPPPPPVSPPPPPWNPPPATSGTPGPPPPSFPPPGAAMPPPNAGFPPPPPPAGQAFPPPPGGPYPPPPGGTYPPPGQPGAFPPPPPGPYSPAFPPGAGYGGAAKPNNFLVPAILATLFCCLPLGIVAIVKAVKVDGLFQTGQYAAAEQAAADAKKWTVWSVGVGVVVAAFYFVLVLGGALSMN